MMNRFLISLALFFLFLTTHSAPSQANQEAVFNHALEFQVNGSFDFATLEGSTFSLKTQTAANHGFRIGLQPTFQQWESVYSDGEYTKRVEMRSYCVHLIAQYLKMQRIDDRTRSYWGLGPVIGWEYEEASSFQQRPEEDPRTEHWIERSWSAGFAADLGVEFFVLETLSLTGQYSFQLEFQSKKTRYGDRKKDSIGLHSSSVRLGLCAYF